MSNPIVTFEMENGDIIKAELYPEVAPNTVNNFISLVSKGFYDGLIFHRVIPGFMIQGGDPKGTGVGGPGYSIKGEFTANRFKNDLKHDRGVLSMARTMDSRLRRKPVSSSCTRTLRILTGSTRLSARSLKASRLWTPLRTSAPIITTSPELRRS